MVKEKTRNYILSIREGPANAIFQGKKPHEFRRRFEDYGTSARIYLYVTKPICEIAGSILVSAPISGSIEEICSLADCNNHHDTKDRLKHYLSGAKSPKALPIISYTKFSKPISLLELRSRLGRYHPPMSYMDIDTQKHARLKAMLERQE